MASNQFFSSLIGHHAEQNAKDYLKLQGLTFVAQNYKVKVGEIDLIMTDQDQLVFVEVKYRKNDYFGSAAEHFTAGKRKRLVRAIMWYLLDHDLNANSVNMRIDLVAIDASTLNWIKNV